MSDDDPKKVIALALLAENPHISTQVVNECSHVLRRRLNWPPTKIEEELSLILELTQLVDVTLTQIRSDWRIAA